MSRGFLITKSDGSYAGWYGHENAINRTKFPEADFEFVMDDDADLRVAAIRAERDAPPPPGPPSVEEDLTIEDNDLLPSLAGLAITFAVISSVSQWASQLVPPHR